MSSAYIFMPNRMFLFTRKLFLIFFLFFVMRLFFVQMKYLQTRFPSVRTVKELLNQVRTFEFSINLFYYMASSASRQDESNPAL